MIGRALVSGLHSLGVKIPDDISVLGLDDAPGDQSSIVPLTSISLDASEVGRQAIDLLLEVILGKVPNVPYRRIRLSPKVIVRATCASPARPKNAV